MESLDGFKNQKGRGIDILNTAMAGCDSCWLVELTFTRNDLYYPEKVEHVRVNVKLKDWKMDSYTFG